MWWLSPSGDDIFGEWRCISTLDSVGLCIFVTGTGDVDEVISFDEPDCPSGLIGAGLIVVDVAVSSIDGD